MLESTHPIFDSPILHKILLYKWNNYAWRIFCNKFFKIYLYLLK